LDAPSCDIAFQELVAPSRTSEDPLEALTTITPGTAIIELAPGVYTTVNVSTKASAEGRPSPSRERNIIGRLGQQIEHLRDTYEDLIRNQEPPEDDEQPSLFPRRRRKK
jgi:hypothetical protein